MQTRALPPLEGHELRQVRWRLGSLVRLGNWQMREIPHGFGSDQALVDGMVSDDHNCGINTLLIVACVYLLMDINGMVLRMVNQEHNQQ